MDDQALSAIARTIIDANLYMVLATADEAGRPWASPVYFANARYTEYFWVSSPEATHSHNIATRPEVGIVIFDSRAPIGTGQGVYMTAIAEAVSPDRLEPGIDVYSRRALAHGGRAWTSADLQSDGENAIRLYRATATAHTILAKDGRPDHRIPAHLDDAAPPQGPVPGA
jgi:Pyridoxamine 5'-phosphate oxidase